MGRAGTMQRSLPDVVERAYERARGTWTGCDWPTAFGQTGLDLNGMTSHQALLMSRATAGEEASDWREAVQWLRLVEADAEAAEESARLAIELIAHAELPAAIRAARAACAMEARYHPAPVWTDLREILEAASRPVYNPFRTS
jgi:hypothetical protein